MKNKLSVTLLIFFCVSAFSTSLFQVKPTQEKKAPANQNYAGYWNTVDSLAKKGLNKSALETVMKIYEKAKNGK